MSNVSARKQIANTLNATLSTGPKTDAGKARSSLNATTHGLFCKSMTLPGEDPRLFDEFRKSMILRLNPRDDLELKLVEQVIASSWKKNRLIEVEKRMIELRQAADPERRDGSTLSAIMLTEKNSALERLYRHQQRMENSMHRALNRLRKLQESELAEPSQYAPSERAKRTHRTNFRS